MTMAKWGKRIFFSLLNAIITSTVVTKTDRGQTLPLVGRKLGHHGHRSIQEPTRMLLSLLPLSSHIRRQRLWQAQAVISVPSRRAGSGSVSCSTPGLPVH